MQPAEPFLDLSGEDIRQRMFLTTDRRGQELCLRPDFTIAVSRDYLASADAGRAAGFCYLGPVFRQGDDGPGEFLQAGVESFGRTDTAAADAEMLSLGLEADRRIRHDRARHPHGRRRPVHRAGRRPRPRAGVEAPPGQGFQPRRTARARSRSCSRCSAGGARSEYEGVLAAMARSDPKAAHALVTDLLSIAGINAVGGRSVGEIADRFLEQAALGAQTSLPQEMRALIERFLGITGDPDKAAAELRTLASDAKLKLDAALDLFESRTGFLAARGVDVSRIRFSTAVLHRARLLHRLRVPAARSERPHRATAGRRRPLRQAAQPARQRDSRSRRSGSGVWIERLAACGRRVMSGPFVIAVPAKGRLQEHTDAFFARAGLELVKPRGERDYRGTINGLPGVEVAYLSAARDHRSCWRRARCISASPARTWCARRCPIPTPRSSSSKPLGFGDANVVVAVPQAWIDVHSMADLDDVATAFRLKHDRKMRVATKYLNLTRGFFSKHGITDYRIVESAGATEAAPATGTAELIVDITSTGSTLAANGLKVVEDGVILRSQANLIASRGADWSEENREIARDVLDRIAAQARARAFREVRTRFADCNDALLAEARERFGVVSPLGGPTSSGMLTLHCPPAQVHALASFLRDKGAGGVTVTGLDYVFARDNPLYAKLEAGLNR